MIEKEALAPERAAARRGGDLQPAARRGCRSGSTRRSATGCDIPPTESITKSQLDTDDAVQHAQAPRACRRRRSRTRASPRCRPPRTRRRSTTSTSSRKPDKPHHFFTASVDDVRRVQGRSTATDADRADAARRAARQPGRAVALAARCRTPPSPRAGSTGRTCRCDVEPDALEDAVRGLVALGFAGANVTIPHKPRRRRALRRGRAATR